MDTRPISKYWRINRSRHEATELALALRAMRKVAGHIGKNIKPVFWRGMTADDNRSIILDPGMFYGKYPIPHRLCDILVGQVVYEGLFSMEFGEWVENKVIAVTPDLTKGDKTYLVNIVAAAESIYINECVNSQIWSVYLNRYFSDSFEKEKRDDRLPPTPESLSNMWKKSAILGAGSDNRHHYYEDPLVLLAGYENRIRAIALTSSLSVRRERRVALYSGLWLDLKQIISQWETFELNPDAINFPDEGAPKGKPDLYQDQDETGEGEEADALEKSLRGLTPELADDVSVMLEEGGDEYRSIAVALQEPGAKAMETRIQKGDVKSDIQPDMVQVRRMKKIFKKQEILIHQVSRKKTRRGLSEGKLDPLRLHRVPLDGKVFKNKQRPDADYHWQICIIADASASMSGKDAPAGVQQRMRRPWEIAEEEFRLSCRGGKGASQSSGYLCLPGLRETSAC